MKVHHADLEPNYQSEPVKAPSDGFMYFLLMLLALCLMAAGFLIGYFFRQDQEHDDRIRKPVGYTVYNADSVINQNGDTVKYQWNKRARK